MRAADGPRFAYAAAALIVLFVAVRLLTVFFLWTRYPDPVFSECMVGAVGREFSRGPILPVLAYQHLILDSMGSITLLAGMEAVVFTLFGPSYAALKMLAVALATAGVAVWGLLVLRVFGRRMALWYCGAAVLVPPALLYWSLWLDPNWTFCDIIHGAALLALVRLAGVGAPCAAPRRDAVVLATLGVLLPIGAFLSNYGCLIAIYSAAVLAYYRVPNSLRKAGAFAAGVLAGAVPHLWYSRHYGNQWAGMRLGAPGSKAHFVTAQSIGGWAADTLVWSASRCAGMLRFWWMESWAGKFVPPGHLGGAMVRAYEACILAGVCLACIALSRASRVLPVPPYPESSRRGVRILFGFFAFIVAMTCLSHIAIPRRDFYPYRYLLPMAPFYLLSTAVCGDRLTLSRTRPVRAAGWSAAAVLAALLIACLVPALRGGNPAALFTARGYDYGYLGLGIAASPLGRPVSRGLAIARRVEDPQDREDFVHCIADTQWFSLSAERLGVSRLKGGGRDFSSADMGAFVLSVGVGAVAADRPVLYRALGRGIAWSHGGDWKAVRGLIGLREARGASGWIPGPIADIFVRPRTMLSPEEARWAWQGAGSVEAWRRGPRSDWLPPLLKDIPKGARAPFCEGAGAVWGFEARRSGWDLQALRAALPPRVRGDCLAGEGIGFCRRPFALLEW